MNEIEEYIWVESGKFNKEDIEAINDIFSVLRGYSQTDKQWFPVDKQSLNEFIESINDYEGREKALVECTK